MSTTEKYMHSCLCDWDKVAKIQEDAFLAGDIICDDTAVLWACRETFEELVNSCKTIDDIKELLINIKNVLITE